MEVYKMTGFKNMGKTCYLNSTVQLLVNIGDYFLYFLTHNQPKDLKYKKQFDVLKKVYIDYHRKESKIIDLSPLLSILPSHFRRNEQQDADECLDVLLHMLIDLSGIHSCKTKVYEINLKTNKRTIIETSKLYLDVPKQANSFTILDCLSDYLKETTVSSRKTRMYIDTLSDYLFVCFKRFQYGEHGWKKVSSLFEKSLKFRLDKKTFVAVGAIIHIGGLNSGHYISIIQKNRKWFVCNDASLKEIKSTNELNEIAKHTYIILYRKAN